MTTGWAARAYTIDDFLKAVMPSLDLDKIWRKPGNGGFQSGIRTREHSLIIRYHKADYCFIRAANSKNFVQITGICNADGLLTLKSVDLGLLNNRREQVTHRYILHGDADSAPKTTVFQFIDPRIEPLDRLRMEATRIAIDHVAVGIFNKTDLELDKIDMVFNPAPIRSMPAVGPYRLCAQRVANRRAKRRATRNLT